MNKMEVSFSQKFKKEYKKKIKDTVEEIAFRRLLETFIVSPFHPRLKNA